MSNSGEIEVGDIFKIAADEENGITPPGGRDVWYKHFVVIGKTSDGSVYGCVVFDSDMNREYVEPGEEEFYLPIQAGRYSFIDHDSYLECLELKPATAEKLLAGRVEGTLRPDDLQEAMKLVKMSRRHSFVLLKTFGIL